MTAECEGHIWQLLKKELKLLGEDNNTIYQIHDDSIAEQLFNSSFDSEEYDDCLRTSQVSTEAMVLKEISSEYKRKIESLGRDNFVIGTIPVGPNEIIVNVSDVRKACQQGAWYDDRTIYQFCQRLLYKEANVNPVTLSYKIFDPLFFAYFGNNDMEAPDIDFSQYRQLIFPVNVNNSHWGVISVNTHNKIIESFDSMNGAALVYHKNLVLNYIQNLSADDGNWTIKAALTPRQQNNNDCGDFT